MKKTSIITLIVVLLTAIVTMLVSVIMDQQPGQNDAETASYSAALS